MPVPGPRVIFITGAPVSSTLQWTDEQLNAPLNPCFLEAYTLHFSRSPPSRQLGPAWRSLSSRPAHLPTGLTQHHGLHQCDDGDETSFLSTTDLSFLSVAADEVTTSTQASVDQNPTQEDILTQFYEHSFAVHEDVSSSLVESETENTSSLSLGTDSECFTINLDKSNKIQVDSHAAYPQRLDRLDGIKDIPNANYLHSILPQTASVNLIVGIISIEPTRTIRTRRDGRLVDLVELVVGDETKAGFGVSFWLPANKQTFKNVDIRLEIEQLRPQDIVLLRNVALSSFKGKVYGQSLRKEMTTIQLLSRNKLDRDDREGFYCAKDLDKHESRSDDPIRCKTQKVRSWVLSFVGATKKLGKANGRRGGLHDQLPLDTQ